MPQETTPSPWSDADATGACLSVVADAQSLWSSLEDTSLRRSAASESSRPAGFLSSDVEAEEDDAMCGRNYGPMGSLNLATHWFVRKNLRMSPQMKRTLTLTEEAGARAASRGDMQARNCP